MRETAPQPKQLAAWPRMKFDIQKGFHGTEYVFGSLLFFMAFGTERYHVFTHGACGSSIARHGGRPIYIQLYLLLNRFSVCITCVDCGESEWYM